VETYFFSKINIYNMLNYFDSFILEFMFLKYIIFMLFVHLLMNYVICTLRNVKYQFNTKYPNNIITLR